MGFTCIFVNKNLYSWVLLGLEEKKKEIGESKKQVKAKIEGKKNVRVQKHSIHVHKCLVTEIINIKPIYSASQIYRNHLLLKCG